MHKAKKLAKKAFPLHTKRGRALKRAAATVGLAKPIQFSLKYQNWIDTVEKELFLPVVQHKTSNKPLFSIVIPFYNTKLKYLDSLFDSIVNQSFGDWELIVADGSSDVESSVVIKNLCEQDSRIKYYKHTKDTDISGNTNQALDHAVGEYIVFCDHDDTLDSHALNEVAAALQADPSIDIVYSDEDKITDDGRWRHEPLFKPDWSPHLFMYTNYTNHLSVVRSTLVEKVGGFRKECNGAQDYDFLLRLHGAQENLNVHHIGKILYHWRQAEGSTAAEFDSKSYAFNAGKKAIETFMETTGIQGTVEVMENRPGFYREILDPSSIKKVLVVSAVSDVENERKAVIERLKSNTVTDLIVEYMSIQPNKLDDVNSDGYDAVFEFTKPCYPEKSDWLDRLVGVLELSDVADVAPRILSSDRQKVVDMGVVYGSDGSKIMLNKGRRAYDMTLNGHCEWVRDVDELSGAVKGFKTKQTKTANRYHVVWSHVDFKHYPVFGKSSMFNANLQLSKKGKIIPNGQ